MKKQIINELIFARSKSIPIYTETEPYTWGEVKAMLEEKKIELQDSDVLKIFFSEAEQSEDTACYSVMVYRKREETDEEFNLRKLKVDEAMEDFAKREYVNYLRLKAKYEKNMKNFTGNSFGN